MTDYVFQFAQRDEYRRTVIHVCRSITRSLPYPNNLPRIERETEERYKGRNIFNLPQGNPTNRLNTATISLVFAYAICRYVFTVTLEANVDPVSTPPALETYIIRVHIRMK